MTGRFKVVLALVLVLATSMFAQTETTTGSINGTVTDADGGALPGVTVTAVNTQTGLSRTVVTESDGTYRVPILPPGQYRVTAELAGLGTAQKDSSTVLLGTSTKVDLNIRPQVSETITVTAATPIVDVTQSASAEAVTQSEIENLPILGRDFKDLVLLTPGVATAFGGRVSLVGARGTAVDYNIDGANANSDFFAEERGGTAAPYVFSQAAIREFQVIRNTYSAEYSRGGGGTMNAITKSGTNELKGEVFYYHRDEEWADERTVAGIEEFFSPRNADQYGFAVGGPIMRDRLFYFVNADLQRIKEPFNAFDFRNSSQFAALPADVRTAVVARLEQLTGHPLEEEFVYATSEDQDTWLGKVDWNIGDSQHLNVRWNYSDFNNFPSESSGSLSAQGDEYNTVNSYVGQLDSILSSSLYNFALVQYSLEERPINNLGNFPFIQIGGLQSGNVQFGHRDFLPNRTDEEKWEIKDTLTFASGNHEIKGGFNYLTVDILNLFARNLSGNFTFGGTNPTGAFLAGTPTRYEQGFGPSPATTFDFSQWGAFVMDSWRPTPRLTLDLGVRYDFMSMPTPNRNVYEAVAPEFDDNFVEDDDNFAPRAGFAYDFRGNGESVLRGGVGMYYTPIPGILLANPISQIQGNFNNYVFTCSATVVCPTFPNLLTDAQLAAANPASIELATISDDFESAESVRASLGFQQRLFTTYSAEVEGIWAQHDKQQRFVHVNNVATDISFAGLRRYNPTAPNRPYPTLGDVRMHVSDAEASYKGVTFALRKLALGDSRLSWLAHYTWSEAIDQDTNSRSTSTSFSFDPNDPTKSEGPSDNDVTHRVVASATYELPYGFLVSGIFNWRTGQPYTRNIFAGSSSTPNALIGLARIGTNVSVFVDENGDVIDLTQANNSTPAEFAAFLDARGARLLGRNTENQPDFMNIDMRLAKRFGLPGGMGIELIAEVFNVLNTANKFITTTNQTEYTITTTGSGANLRYRVTKNANYGVENGLDFNSPPRQYQAAVKFTF